MNRIQTKIIVDAMDSEHLLSEWEMEFINSMADKDAEYDVTPKQNEILNRICTKLNSH